MIYSALLGPFKFMPTCSVFKRKLGMGYVKMHGFHGNLLYDSRDWGRGGVRHTNSIISRILLILEH